MDYEIIVIKLQIHGKIHCFISAYKPPNEDSPKVLDHLDNVVGSLGNTESITVVGDLNINMLNLNPMHKIAIFFAKFKSKMFCK